MPQKLSNEKYILSTKTHEDWRNYLLVNSFFFEVLLRHLRKKMGIPQEGFKNWEERRAWEPEKRIQLGKKLLPKSRGGNKSGTRKLIEHFNLEFNINRELYKPVFDILEFFGELNLSFGLVTTFLLGETRISFTGTSKVLTVMSPDDPIIETGVYMKYTPGMSDKELIMLKSHAKKAYTTLSHVKDFKIPPDSKKWKKSPSKENLKMFLAVESFLLKNYLDKPHSFIIDTIFEKVAEELKVSLGTVRRQYYNIVRNYQLPSTPELNKIPIN